MSDIHPLRAWRKKNGKTLAEIGKIVGVYPSYISDIERGNKEPSLALAAKLSDVADIPINSFVKQSEAAA